MDLLVILALSVSLIAFLIVVARVLRERNWSFLALAALAVCLAAHQAMIARELPKPAIGDSVLELLASTSLLIATLVLSRSRSRSEREEILQAMLDGVPDGVVAADQSGRFIAFNPAAERIVGIGETDTEKDQWTSQYGIFLSDMVTPCPTNELPLVRAMRKETFHDVEVFIRNKKVPYGHWLSINGSPILDKKSRANGGIIVFRDITMRRQAERALRESEERFRDLAENIREVLYIQDARGEKLHYVNPQYEKVWGRSCESFYDNPKQWVDTIHHLDRARIVKAMESRIETGIFNEEYRVQRPDDEIRWVWDRSIAVRDTEGHVVRMVGIAEDVTDRKAMIQELADKEALARLGELGAVVAHEVKNPLAGIAGALTVIRARMTGENSDQHIINEILERIDALDRTVNDILVFARPQTPESQAVPILLLLQDGVRFLLQDPQFKEVHVDITGEDVQVNCDVDLLKPVFLNFLVNAAQAMDGKGRITITVESLEDICQITVVDTGPGIPVKVHARIFEPFFTTKPAGSGLGLPIAKKVIELHGGQISVASPPEGGTTLVVRLPLRQAPQTSF